MMTSRAAPSMTNTFFTLFECVAKNVGGGEIWSVGNANHPHVKKAWTKRNLDQLATGKCVKLQPPSITGNLPLISEISSKAESASFVQAVRDNCATVLALEHNYGPGKFIEPEMFESFGQPIEKQLSLMLETVF